MNSSTFCYTITVYNNIEKYQLALCGSFTHTSVPPGSVHMLLPQDEELNLFVKYFPDKIYCLQPSKFCAYGRKSQVIHSATFHTSLEIFKDYIEDYSNPLINNINIKQIEDDFNIFLFTKKMLNLSDFLLYPLFIHCKDEINGQQYVFLNLINQRN